MSELSSFEVMDFMMDAGKDLRVYSKIEAMSCTKEKSTITIEIDAEVANDLRRNAAKGEPNHYIALYIVNKQEFDEIKNG